MWKLPDFWKVIIDRGSAGGPHPEGGRTSRDLFLRCTSDRHARLDIELAHGESCRPVRGVGVHTEFARF